MSFGVSFMQYVVVVATLIIAGNAVLVQIKLGTAMHRFNVWIEDHGLDLALSKTEIVMLTKRRIPTVIPTRVGYEVIQIQTRSKVVPGGYVCQPAFQSATYPLDWPEGLCTSVSAQEADSESRWSVHLKRQIVMASAQSACSTGLESGLVL